MEDSTVSESAKSNTLDNPQVTHRLEKLEWAESASHINAGAPSFDAAFCNLKFHT